MLSAGWNISGILLHARSIPQVPKPEVHKPAAAKDGFTQACNALNDGVTALLTVMLSPLLLAGQAAKELTSKDTDPIQRITMIGQANESCAGLLAQIVNDPENDPVVRTAAIKKIHSFKFHRMSKQEAHACIQAQLLYIHELADQGSSASTLRYEVNRLYKDMINWYQIYQKNSPLFSRGELEDLAAQFPSLKGGSVKVWQSHWDKNSSPTMMWVKAEQRPQRRRNRVRIVRVFQRSTPFGARIPKFTLHRKAAKAFGIR